MSVGRQISRLADSQLGYYQTENEERGRRRMDIHLIEDIKAYGPGREVEKGSKTASPGPR